MNLTNFEKETVILFNEEEDKAQIETFNPRLLGQLRKVAACDGVICERSEKGYGAYIVPKTMIKIRAPQKLSDDEIKRRTELLKSNLTKKSR